MDSICLMLIHTRLTVACQLMNRPVIYTSVEFKDTNQLRILFYSLGSMY